MYQHTKKTVAEYDFDNMTDFEDVLSKVNDDFPADNRAGHWFDYEMVLTVFEETLSDGSTCKTISISRKEY